MKHRSVIGFVIVAAALFSLPQLSHDLSALKGEVGARVQRELLYAFLSMPEGEPTAAAPTAARPAGTLLASCPKEKSGVTAARPGKVEANGRAEGRSEAKSFEESAMLGDPVNDPVSQVVSADIKKAAALAVKLPEEVKVETEVAMIISPEGGIDPRVTAGAFASGDAARAEAQQFRAEGLRVAYAAAARFGAKGPEWQRATEEAVRELDGSLPGAYEFRVVRDGAKPKVIKFKCGECPPTALPLPRLPRQVAVDMLVPAPVVPVETAGE